MAPTGWSVDGHRLEYFGRRATLFSKAGLTIDGAEDAECRVKHSRPDYEFFLGNRRLVLKTIGERTGELWSRGLLIPPTAQHVPLQPAPGGSVCAQHASNPARGACARCGVFFCAECEGPDGTHCASCLPTISEADESRRVLAAAGPAQAVALFGGHVGKVIAVVDSQIEQRVQEPRHRRWIRLLVFGSIAAALAWWLLSHTHSPPGW